MSDKTKAREELRAVMLKLFSFDIDTPLVKRETGWKWAWKSPKPVIRVQAAKEEK